MKLVDSAIICTNILTVHKRYLKVFFLLDWVGVCIFGHRKFQSIFLGNYYVGLIGIFFIWNFQDHFQFMIECGCDCGCWSFHVPMSNNFKHLKQNGKNRISQFSNPILSCFVHSVSNFVFARAHICVCVILLLTIIMLFL